MAELRDKAQEWLCREIRKTKVAQGQAESRPGVTQEELDNIQNKVDVLDWLLEMIGCSSGSRWISVEDRLPEGEVLAANFLPGTYGYKEYIIGYVDCVKAFDPDFKGEEFYATNEFEILKNVTHWMHLPEPPKEETK